MRISVELEEALDSAIKTFEVRWTVETDHPEKKDSSFRPVKAGTRTPFVQKFDNQKRAIAYAKGLLSGEDDFASEYVANVTVLQTYAGKGPRVVMNRVERERGADGKVKTKSKS
jgi:hypothetical protein